MDLIRNIEPSGPGTRGQGVRLAPVHCDSCLLGHAGLKGSARRHKIPCTSVCIHTPYYAELVPVSHCTDLWGSVKAMAGFSSIAYGKGSIMFEVRLPFSYRCSCREHECR